MESARRVALSLVLLALLAACGSSHRAAPALYRGHLYSVAQVRAAFAQLGLQLQSEPSRAPGLVQLVNNSGIGGEHLGARHHLVDVLVGTRRAPQQRTVTIQQGPTVRVTGYANVTVVAKLHVGDEVRGALSALRWGTLSQSKPAARLIVPGKSIGNVWLGEKRKHVEQALGRGKTIRPGFVTYPGRHLVVVYDFHDRIYPWVSYLETRWSGYQTRSGVHVGSSRQALRSLYATCDNTACHLLEGPWPDALATNFRLRDGRVTDIAMGPS